MNVAITVVPARSNSALLQLQFQGNFANVDGNIASVNFNNGSSLAFRRLETDSQGKVAIQDLLPGDYKIVAQNVIHTLSIREGQNAPLGFAVRLGDLRGRIVDSQGKPVSGVIVSVQGGVDPQTALMRGGEAIDNPDVLSNLGMQSEINTVTTLDGAFSIPNFNWANGRVRIRAVTGRDVAVWSGRAEQIGAAPLQIKLHKDALITVTGRLVDPQRHAIARAICQTLHWQSTPRSAWFATAKQLQIDENGHFRVDGLERGESFSIISTNGGPRQGGRGVHSFDGGVHSFEIPAL